jgi:hypothetical protein
MILTFGTPKVNLLRPQKPVTAELPSPRYLPVPLVGICSFGVRGFIYEAAIYIIWQKKNKAIPITGRGGL